MIYFCSYENHTFSRLFAFLDANFLVSASGLTDS